MDRVPGAELGRSSAPKALEPYFADIDVSDGPAEDQSAITGTVFEDKNRDGVRQSGERGIGGVLVSNGLTVTATNGDGVYRLAARGDMSVSVVQPAGWRVPTDENWVPQFSYEHKAEGSAKAMRFGGLDPTGLVPGEVNFPLIRSDVGDAFNCAVLGDVQAYSNNEVGYTRDSLVVDLINRGPGGVDCMLLLGDVLGDDLGLIPRLSSVLGAVRAPQWWVHGNHDFDFDADSDRDSADTWRREFGPNYFALEMGDALIVALDNVVYPCTPEDAKGPGRETCADTEKKSYNGRVPDEQIAWLKSLLDQTPTDKTVVVMTHIPLVTFINAGNGIHQTDNVREIYALMEGREALSLSGHTHTLEHLSPGDSYKGWNEAVGVEKIPFRHIVAGAVSGSWWQGDFDINGVPMSLMRLGGPRGWMDLAFDGPDYVETYYGTGLAPHRRMFLSMNTPAYRTWFGEILAWMQEDQATRDPVPPKSINDLNDVKLVTPQDLKAGTYLTANVWLGSTETIVRVRIAERPAAEMTRTQEAKGEEMRIGVDYADPFAIQRQATVARNAIQSRSGDERAQGQEFWTGRQFPPSPPGPQTSSGAMSSHLWRYKLPEDLVAGVHVAEVIMTDRHGRTFTESLVFEVRDERPPPRFRLDVWNAFTDGPPVR